MNQVLSFLLTVVVVVPVSVYFILQSVFHRDIEPAGPGDFLNVGAHIPHFLSPHDSERRPQSFAGPLATEGRYIVDANGTRVKLFSVNWYGASDAGFCPGGLEMRHRSEIALTIKKLGFNSVRLPYADELVYKNPLVSASLLAANPDLIGKSAEDVFSAVVEALTHAGLLVVINNHITQARWCCDAGLCDGSWRNDHWGSLCRIRQTETSWIQNLETMMRPHVDNPRVIGVDLRNEVRGITDRLMWNSWASAAERAAFRLHALQPDWLIFVEGVSSANNIGGAQARPVRLTEPRKLVYSAHVYGWSGWGSMVPFWRRSYESFSAEMHRNWGFLLADEVAPVWIGEFGAPSNPSRSDLHYWNHLVLYLRETDADVGYWALNPRKFGRNESETYGILRDDWKTPVLDYRLYDMISLMADSGVQ